nr:hypothetical protein [Candidatus Sigynarchaeum springense]
MHVSRGGTSPFPERCHPIITSPRGDKKSRGKFLLFFAAAPAPRLGGKKGRIGGSREHRVGVADERLEPGELRAPRPGVEQDRGARDAVDGRPGAVPLVILTPRG